jgi:hypothetical protein
MKEYKLESIDQEIKELFERVPEEKGTSYLFLKTINKNGGFIMATQGDKETQIKTIITAMLEMEYLKDCIFSAMIHYFFERPKDAILFYKKLNEILDSQVN